MALFKTYVLLLFTVVTVCLVTTIVPGEGDGGDCRKGNPLVSRAEENVKFRDSGLSEYLGIGVRSGIEERARI